MAVVEQRVVGAKPKIGANKIQPRDRGEAPAPEAEETTVKKRGKLPLIVGLLVVAVLAGAASVFFLKPSGEGDAEPEAPVPGEIVTLESMNINLDAGHYLRIGLGLQLVEGAEEINVVQAQDATIALFTGRPVDEVKSPEGRIKLKTELAAALEEIYEGMVMDVYLTDFVTQ